MSWRIYVRSLSVFRTNEILVHKAGVLVTSAGGSHFSQTDLEALAAIQVIGTGKR